MAAFHGTLVYDLPPPETTAVATTTWAGPALPLIEGGIPLVVGAKMIRAIGVSDVTSPKT